MMVPKIGGMDVRDAVNRGFNMMIATILGLTALTFGSEIFGEPDAVDKLDNTFIAIVGVIAVVWYFMGRNWARRSGVPVMLVGAALVAQIFGIFVEIGDPTAIGDDIPGLIIFVALLIVSLVLYSAHGRMLAQAASPAT